MALLRGARTHTPMRQLSSHPPPWSVRPFALCYALLCELRRGVYIVPLRIAAMRSKAEDEQGCVWIHGFPSHERDAAIPTHNEGIIRSSRIRHPWLTVFDAGPYLEGLLAGAMLRSRNSFMEEPQSFPKRKPPKCDARRMSAILLPHNAHPTHRSDHLPVGLFIR